MTIWRALLRMPWLLLLLAAVLVTVGALALYSASQGSWQPWAGRHIVRAAVGLAVVLVVAFIDINLIRRTSYVLLTLAVIVLAALMLIGSGAGVARWISIGGMNLQPSEPAKIAVILALARYFDSQPLGGFSRLSPICRLWV